MDNDGDNDINYASTSNNRVGNLLWREYVTDLTIDVEDDGDSQWKLFGEYTMEGEINDGNTGVNNPYCTSDIVLSQAIQNYLDITPADPMGYVSVPISFSSTSMGQLKISDMIVIYW